MPSLALARIATGSSGISPGPSWTSLGLSSLRDEKAKKWVRQFGSFTIPTTPRIVHLAMTSLSQRAKLTCLTAGAMCLILTSGLGLTGCATSSGSSTVQLTEPTVVEAACGECLFGLKGKGCDLAVRINGKAYYVDGVLLDSLGDAHAADGMCQKIRKAKVTGEVQNRRFKAKSFELLAAAQ